MQKFLDIVFAILLIVVGFQWSEINYLKDSNDRFIEFSKKRDKELIEEYRKFLFR